MIHYIRMAKKEGSDITKTILTVVATAGVISLVLLAPNTVQLLRFFKKKYDPLYYVNKRAREMIERGLLEKRGASIMLTERGRRYLEKVRIKEKRGKKQKWDGKWRVLIFDVWEKRRGKRDMLRREIKEFGFVQLQQSVWIYPFPCGDFLELLKADLRFGKNIRYLIVEQLDSDAKLRKRFGL